MDKWGIYEHLEDASSSSSEEYDNKIYVTLIHQCKLYRKQLEVAAQIIHFETIGSNSLGNRGDSLNGKN
jgi:hypothetical protein